MQTFKAARGEVAGIGFNPDGRKLVTISGGDALLWSVPDMRELGVEELGPGDQEAAQHISLLGRNAVNPDGDIQFVYLHDDFFRWNLEGGAGLEPCDWGGTRESNGGRKFPVGVVTAHPMDPVLAMACGVLDEDADEWRSGIEFFDIGSGEQLALIVAPFRKAHIERLVYSPDGAVIVGLNGPMWRAWSTDSGELLAEQECGRKHLRDLAFSPDGSRMVTVGNDTNVRVWSTADWSEVNGFEWDIGPLTCVAVSPDGTLYAAGSKKGKVVLWDDWP